ncbi:S9 family peptidase [Rhodanobacter glycinis]|uniref:Dipeptidyl aminopeptidase/acylaminoacyl peptidase n=1 Tax=Rhodanobacter glycinis TaxID=582702 RepID=A0A1I4F7G3_9GAMM|nr:S9 family peptidase [Rhodanobacter glycinis]SFL13844.1 Dipeptidyl aminopeptidase/acylaminoacyl peptidase [Rhodanobacter glycinis]
MLKPVHLLLPLLAAAFVPTAFADTSPTPATDPRIEHLLKQLDQVQHIGDVAISPDGRQLAWTMSVKDKPVIELADANGRNAHVLDVGAKLAECSKRDIAWSPDSRQLAFIADCSHDLTNTQPMHNDVYLADVGGKAAPREVASLTGYARAMAWTNNGKSLGFLFVPGATRHASATAAGKEQVGVIGEEGIEVQHVASLDVASGTLHELTPASLYAYEFNWSPDGARIAYTAAPPPGDNNWWINKLYVQDAKPGATPRVVVDPSTVKGSLHGLQMALPRWSPDGSRVAFIGGLMSDQGATGGDIYSVPANGGALSNLTPGVDVTLSWFSWTGPQSLLVSQNAKGKVQLAAYTVSGDRAKAQTPYFTVPAMIGNGRAVLGVSLSADHRMVAFSQSSFEHAPEVHAGPLGHTPPPAVTAFNAALKPSWGKAVSVEWTNEGRHVQGWLLYPANYDPHKTYPMIVSVHGGPAWGVLSSWPGTGAMYAATGYFEFMPNPRGSYGQGEAFVQANRRDFGYGDLRDILAGVDAVEKMVPVDDHRLGLTGWSYGGFMTMFTPTQTQRFRAAVAGAGLSDWQSYYGENRIDQWMIPFFGASLYDDPAVYAKSSAINFVKQAKTPTLIVVGDRDEECPAPQSFEYWHALKTLGVPTQLVVYPNEGHHFANPKHVRDVLQRSLDWFAKYLPASK